jgi:uncharacterized protein (TIGR00369 family)
MGKTKFTNSSGNIHGGFLAAMLDDTMRVVLAATLLEGEFAPTIGLKVQFLSPATVGKIEAFGKIDKRGKEVCHLTPEALILIIPTIDLDQTPLPHSKNCSGLH